MRALILLAIICVFASVSGQSHDWVIGHVTDNDVLLDQSLEQKNGIPFLYRVSLRSYPSFEQVPYAEITAVSVKDHYTDGSGGYASIFAGGVGDKEVNIKFESQRSSGFNFTVSVFGRYH